MNNAMSLGAVISALLWFVSLMASPAKADSQPPLVGVPYISFTVTPAPGVTYNEANLANAAAVWLQFKFPSVFSSIDVNNDVVFYDQQYNISGSDSNDLSLSLSFPKYDNGVQCVYLQQMTDVLASGVFGLNYSVTSVLFVENPSPTVAIGFSTFGTQYNGYYTAVLQAVLTFSPSIGTNVSFSIANQLVDVVPAILVITYPSLTATFTLRANVTGTYLFNGQLLGGTDLMLRYDFDVSLQSNTFTTIPPASLSMNDISTPTYALTVSDPYSVLVPQTFLYSSFSVAVYIFSYPPGLSVSPSVLQISRRGVPSQFTVSGPKGLYTLKYVVSAAADGKYFVQPTLNTSVLILKKLNITTFKIPDAYSVNKYFSPQYGGAFSVPVTVVIEGSPKKLLVVQINAQDSFVSPPFLTFAPGGVTNFTFILQAQSVGVKQISYAISGASVLDYTPPPLQFWRVYGPNTRCFRETLEESCFHVSGCNWNEHLALCSNRSLPIALSHIPLLFDREPHGNLSFTLPTAVRHGLTVTFYATARLSFSPAVIDLAAGESSANFTILPLLLPRDGQVVQPFVLMLSGPDANIFVQQRGEASIRSQIKCSISGPWSIFVFTNSSTFSVTCDTEPETYTTFLPYTPQTGTSIQFDVVGELAADNASVVMTTPNKTALFIARSTSSEARIFYVSLIVGGPNAFRYAPIDPVPLNVLPPGELNVLPRFVVEAHTISAPYHLDLSIVPDDALNVTLTVINASSMMPVAPEVVWITPNITFNKTKLGLVRVLGKVPGKYYVNYTIAGPSATTFAAPMNSTFNVTEATFGSAFVYALQLGFQPLTRCRVNVGRNSEFFPGQAPIDEASKFCEVYNNTPASNVTSFDCASLSSQRECQIALEQTGYLCVWNASSGCVLLEGLQGQVVDVAYGSDFTLLLTVNKTVWSLGSNDFGQLGHPGNDLGLVALPEQIAGVVAGVSHGFALSQSGNVYGWGNNNFGQLGRGSVTQHDVVPALIRFPPREVISCLSSGALHAAAVSHTGTLYTWGSNEFGQLGTDSFFRGYSRSPVPLPRTSFDGDSVVNIQCGEFHTMAASDLNTFTFGRNTQGQLGRPGYDETVAANPVLRAPTPYILKPQYPSALHGNIDCSSST